MTVSFLCRSNWAYIFKMTLNNTEARTQPTDGNNSWDVFATRLIRCKGTWCGRGTSVTWNYFSKEVTLLLNILWHDLSLPSIFLTPLPDTAFLSYTWLIETSTFLRTFAGAMPSARHTLPQMSSFSLLSLPWGLLKHHLDCSPARTPNKKIVAALHSLLYLLLFSSSHLSLSDLLYHYFICLYAFSVAGLYRFFFLSIQYPCLNSAWKMSDSQYIFLN